MTNAARTSAFSKPATQTIGTSWADLSTAPNQAQAEKPKNQLWLNIGIEIAHPETGEMVFISVPMGVGLDQLQPRKGSSWETVSSNALLLQLLQEGQGLPAGERAILEGLTVQLSRVGEAITPEVGGFNLGRRG
jgi:hypothetical protein